MMNRFRNWFARFMYGRYGSDGLNRFLSTASLVLFVLSMFTGWNILYWLGLVGIILCYVRMFSYNREKRAAENRLFYEKTQTIRSLWANRKKRKPRDPNYKYFRCPRCGQELRVPRGRGKLEITCPKCKAQFTKKS